LVLHVTGLELLGDAIFDRVACGEDQDKLGVGLTAQVVENLQAVAPGQHEV
jgi:hypothetical protein